MTLTKLIIAAAALSFAATGAADAAGQPKRHKVARASAIVAYLPAYAGTPRPPWAAPWECYTDEGYGRFRSCSAGRR